MRVALINGACCYVIGSCLQPGLAAAIGFVAVVIIIINSMWEAA